MVRVEAGCSYIHTIPSNRKLENLFLEPEKKEGRKEGFFHVDSTSLFCSVHHTWHVESGTKHW